MIDDDSLTDRVMGDMPADLLRFVKERVTSFVKFDLIRFFHDNQSDHNNLEEIAQYVGHDEELLQSALDELVADDILDEMMVTSGRAYALTKDPLISSRVKRFVEACEDAAFRTKVIFHIIRGMR